MGREKARIVLDTANILHAELVEYWTKENELYRKTRRHNIKNRYERIHSTDRSLLNSTKGDKLLQQTQDLFYEGMGLKWSEVQLKIFKAFIDSCLPKIYGDEWEEVKQRVMFQRGLARMQQETLVNMARRNGKTFVTSGTAAALFLMIPNLSVAVFSVSERQSKMLMTATLEKIDAAFEKGTHVNRQGYTVISKNKELLVMEHPNGGKQVLGCYPGSVRVSFLFYSFSFLGF